ncbi:MAG: hypothetical protein M3Y04_02575 [Actinomycetota bacterium]|nr:hypothetical protein [Actinomycetota bacterium]
MSAGPGYRYCTGCGRAAAACAGDCPGAGPLDPPRFCPECGRRLSVQVFPSRVAARCRDHGHIPSSPPP